MEGPSWLLRWGGGDTVPLVSEEPTHGPRLRGCGRQRGGTDPSHCPAPPRCPALRRGDQRRVQLSSLLPPQGHKQAQRSRPPKSRSGSQPGSRGEATGWADGSDPQRCSCFCCAVRFSKVPLRPCLPPPAPGEQAWGRLLTLHTRSEPRSMDVAFLQPGLPGAVSIFN